MDGGEWPRCVAQIVRRRRQSAMVSTPVCSHYLGLRPPPLVPMILCCFRSVQVLIALPRSSTAGLTLESHLWAFDSWCCQFLGFFVFFSLTWKTNSSNRQTYQSPAGQRTQTSPHELGYITSDLWTLLRGKGLTVGLRRSSGELFTRYIWGTRRLISWAAGFYLHINPNPN